MLEFNFSHVVNGAVEGEVTEIRAVEDEMMEVCAVEGNVAAKEPEIIQASQLYLACVRFRWPSCQLSIF